MKRSRLLSRPYFCSEFPSTKMLGRRRCIGRPKGLSRLYTRAISCRARPSPATGAAAKRMGAKGLTFDLNITQIGQGVVNGGKSGVWQYGGRGDMVMNADSEKLGLWPGGFFNMELEGNWASSVNRNTGALMPVNASQTVPLPPGDIFGVPAWNFTQFLSPYFGLTLGKFATVTDTSGDMNEFAHGKGATQFMNMAFNFNPLIAFTVPYSTLGTGVSHYRPKIQRRPSSLF